MIVLDEQLQGNPLRHAISAWYRGAVTDLTALRPGTRIPDDAIPALLRTVRQPIFVTLNVSDFWRRLAPDAHFCVVNFALTHLEAPEIPALLRRLFTLERFRTRRGRMGTIVRVSRQQVQFYTTDSWAVQTLDWDAED